MRDTRRAAIDVFNNPILVGTVTILITLVAVYLSYIAENGLPFQPTYNIKVDVVNADELVKNADVRIGGARVGQVLTINPEPASATWPHPYAELGLALNQNLDPLPADTHYQVRLASVLGGKYLEILPGQAKTGGVPAGGTLTLNTNPRLNHDLPFVDLDTAFAAFGPKTQQGLRGVLQELGDSTAGRGTQFNDTVYSLERLMGPLQRLLRLFASPTTRLGDFISGAAATTGALAGVAPTFNSLLADSATTFQAMARPTLGEAVDQLPPTEAVATVVLTNARPVLTDAANLVEALKPGAALLPLGSQRLDQIITGATPVFREVPPVAADLQVALVSVEALARDPASSEVFNVLGSSDLATFGSSAFVGLGAILRAAAPSQFTCNVTGLWVRNFAAGLTEGDSTGSWLRFAPIIDPTGGTHGQGYENGTIAPDLHLNYYPIENGTQCQAGNEGYTGTQLVGNPPTTSNVVDNTSPPPGALARGRKAGLVP